MAHKLGFFANKSGATAKDVRDAYLASTKGQAIDWPACPELMQFTSALELRFPQLSHGSAETAGNHHWTADFHQSEGWLIVSIAVHAAEEVGAYIWELLQQHHLVVYDPQSDRAYLGIEELQGLEREKPWWRLWK